MMPERRLQAELRTQEAIGQGTDVRLVLLEAAMVHGHLVTLDTWIALLAGDPPASMNDRRRGLGRANESDDPVLDRLRQEWAGLDLQEVTMRLREIDDLIDLLLRGAS